MQTDEPDIDEIVSKPLPGDRQIKRKHWPLVWPWLSLLGLLIIGIGIYVPDAGHVSWANARPQCFDQPIRLAERYSSSPVNRMAASSMSGRPGPISC